MKKYLLSIALCLLGFISSNAQEKVYVHLKSGTKVAYNVSEVDSITFGYADPNAISIKGLSLQSKTNVSATISVPVEGERSILSSVGIIYSVVRDNLNLEKGSVARASYIADKGDINVTLSGLMQETTYYAIAFAQLSDRYVYSEDTLEFVTNGKYPEPQMVDLGLSVKWASWNVGAQNEGEIGSYVGWGDPTGEQTSYKSSDYPVINTSTTISGSQYDIAHAKWGKGWKMPTFAQMQELWSNCTWTVETQNGVIGWRITSNINGNSIFLPRGGAYNPVDGKYQYSGDNGVAIYWTSEQVSSTNAQGAMLYSFTVNESSMEKMMHLPVRAIYDDNSGGDTPTPSEPIPGEQVELSPNAGNAVDLGLSILWADKNVGANYPEDAGDYFAWGETTTKSNFDLSTYSFYDSSTGTYSTPEGKKHIATSKYDAARMNWGYKWRMPTQEEIIDLVENCTWTWDATKGGYNVTGSTGKSIFFPCVGYKDGSNVVNASTTGCYWSDTNYDREETYLDKHGYELQVFYYDSGNGSPIVSINCVDNNKEMGFAIRPVMDK